MSVYLLLESSSKRSEQVSFSEHVFLFTSAHVAAIVLKMAACSHVGVLFRVACSVVCLT